MACPSQIYGRKTIFPIGVNGATIYSLIDSGSQVSIISEYTYRKWFDYLPLQKVDESQGLMSASGGNIPYLGAISLAINLGKNLAGSDVSVNSLFLVTSEGAGVPLTHGLHTVLVGMNTLEEVWSDILECGEDIQPCLLSGIFRALAEVGVIEHEKQSHIGKLRVTQSVTIPPQSKVRIKASCRPKNVSGVVACIYVSGPENVTRLVTSLYNKKLTSYTRLNVLLANDTDNIVSLQKGHILGSATLSEIPFTLDEVDLELEAIQEDFRVDEHTEVEGRFDQKNHPGLTDEDEEDILPDFRKFLDSVRGHKKLSERDRDRLLDVITENDRTFSKSEYDIGCVKGVKHAYVLKDDVPFKLRHRNLSPKMYGAAKDHIEQLLQKGIIRPSVSPYSSAPMFIRKPDGRVRMVADLRYLNDKTVRDNYALPRFDDILPFLAGSHYFSKMDVRSGYYNLEIEECDKEKTAFSTVFGLYEYNRMVQGAKTSAATFQRCMENILRPLLYEGVIVFLDDVIIYTKDVTEHLRLLNEVLRLMADAGLKLNPCKCDLLQEEILYLGHIINKDGVKANTAKTDALLNYPQLVTIRDVQSFLGFCSYFRAHIPHFAMIAKPLLKLTEGVKYRRKSKFGPPVKQPGLEVSVLPNWTSECQKAREKLIELLTNAPLLLFPDMNKPFLLHIDACGSGLGAVLLQHGADTLLHPCAYASRSLKLAERNYPVYKLEFLGLKWAVVDKFHHYLYGNRFSVYTDNNPLTYLNRSLRVDATGQRWISLLGEYDFTIHYKPGELNVDADILSRLHEEPRSVCSIQDMNFEFSPLCEHIDLECFKEKKSRYLCSTQVRFDWLQLQSDDAELRTVITILKSGDESKVTDFPHRYRKLYHKRATLYFNDKGILCRRAVVNGVEHSLVVLPVQSVPSVLHALHDECGHFGVDHMISLFQQRFYANGYIKLISDYVRSCPKCKIVKTLPVRKGRLGELKASRPFEMISMDFLSLDIDENKYKSVLVVTDVFTKWAFAFPTKNQFASTVAKLLVNEVFSVFGVPERLLSDQGPNFESKLIAEVCALLGIKKVRTCPYSPRSDGICERFNRTLCNMIATLKGDSRKRWNKHILHLVNIYNNTEHAATGFSPFELIFGRKSRLPVDEWLGTAPVDASFDSVTDYVKSLKQRMSIAHQAARENIETAHLKNKSRYDMLVKSVVLSPGDRVLCRNVGVKGMHKLEPLWMPKVYEVVRCVNENTRVYELKCVSNKRMANRVLHIDMLLPISKLEDEFVRTRLGKSVEEIGEIDKHDFHLLFGDEGVTSTAGADASKAKPKQVNNEPSGSQKSRYNLRSRVALDSDDDPEEDTSDSEDEEGGRFVLIDDSLDRHEAHADEYVPSIVDGSRRVSFSVDQEVSEHVDDVSSLLPDLDEENLDLGNSNRSDLHDSQRSSSTNDSSEVLSHDEISVREELVESGNSIDLSITEELVLESDGSEDFVDAEDSLLDFPDEGNSRDDVSLVEDSVLAGASHSETLSDTIPDHNEVLADVQQSSPVRGAGFHLPKRNNRGVAPKKYCDEFPAPGSGKGDVLSLSGYEDLI